ncbi:MAG: MATE family efflux transporter [Alphaproteobacteria bacterium]|nr:MATE family efflux transporter [Alphaproteobacteria bacterium]
MNTSLQISTFWARWQKKFRAGQATRAAVWAIALPVMLANVTVPFVGMVDTAVMGHLDHAHYIGGVAMGSFIFSLITTTFGFQRMATTGLIAQAAGAGQKDVIFMTLYRAVVIALGLGLGIIAFSVPVIALARLALTASQAVLAGMETYISILAWAGPAICLNMVGLGLMFGLQKVRYCMVQLVVINSVNIVANLAFVFGLGMKIEGVAFASVLAQYVGLGVSILLVRACLGPFRQWRPVIWAEAAALGALSRYAALGRDLTIRTLCIILGEVMVLNASAGLGDEVIAASQLGFVIFGLMAYSLDGFAHAAEALVGTAVGKRDLKALRIAIRESTILALMTAAMMTAVIFMFGPAFMRVLTSIPEVLAEAETVLFWLAVMPVTSVLAFQMDGVFIGATKARIMRNAMVVSMAVFVPVLVLGKFWAGLDGIWIAFNILLALRGLTLWLKVRDVHAEAR